MMRRLGYDARVVRWKHRLGVYIRPSYRLLHTSPSRTEAPLHVSIDSLDWSGRPGLAGSLRETNTVPVFYRLDYDSIEEVPRIGSRYYRSASAARVFDRIINRSEAEDTMSDYGPRENVDYAEAVSEVMGDLEFIDRGEQRNVFRRVSDGRIIKINRHDEAQEYSPGDPLKPTYPFWEDYAYAYMAEHHPWMTKHLVQAERTGFAGVVSMPEVTPASRWSQPWSDGGADWYRRVEEWREGIMEEARFHGGDKDISDFLDDIDEGPGNFAEVDGRLVLLDYYDTEARRREDKTSDWETWAPVQARIDDLPERVWDGVMRAHPADEEEDVE
jgi:hypothetical protein